MSMAASAEQGEEEDEFIECALDLLDAVYGANPYAADWPRPLRSNEAGPCRSGQRRYLWTDAFAVMAYQSLSEHFANLEKVEKARMYHEAAEKLISVVHDGLGQPRNSNARGMKQCAISPTGYVGLRAGKPTAKKQTDFGSRYDGQYWHYIDKWLFALERTNHIEEGVRIAKSVFPSFFRNSAREIWATGEEFVHDCGGMRYKISVDASPPARSIASEYANQDYDDTLNALVVYSMLEAKNEHKDTISLSEEISKLEQVLERYSNVEHLDLRYDQPSHCTDAEIDWGMAAIFDQFVVGHPRRNHHGFAEKGKGILSHWPRNDLKRWNTYGALMGAVADGTMFSEESLDRLLGQCAGQQEVQYNRVCSNPVESDRKAGMERVMLAMALVAPGVLNRRDGDVMVNGGSIYWPYNERGDYTGN